ncbi:hypothetical protein Goshw_012390 [Gossypium schwendimanii]|uniref:Uncharacterized protein n=1 Tax=Gossypium schwendimanii TaxID=34291 RepID=A0A7J9KY03_GOSSC|nr:hypothetical protein [Gossypium schwendimanii]
MILIWQRLAVMVGSIGSIFIYEMEAK